MGDQEAWTHTKLDGVFVPFTRLHQYHRLHFIVAIVCEKTTNCGVISLIVVFVYIAFSPMINK